MVVRSVTGYDRRFPLGDADRLLVATSVAGEELSPGHGFLPGWWRRADAASGGSSGSREAAVEQTPGGGSHRFLCSDLSTLPGGGMQSGLMRQP